jgi:hypothetical protein
VADCDLCTCTFEARNSDLIRGAVVVFLITVSVLLVLALINAIPTSKASKVRASGVLWEEERADVTNAGCCSRFRSARPMA